MSATAASAASASHLSDAERQLLERRLLEERRRVLRALERTGRLRDESGATDGGRMPTHPAELGSEAAQEMVDGALSAHEARTLAEIDDALRRLYQQPARFGLDEETSEPIPFARLDIIPWARRGVRRA
jgi:RNA polymerase-binding transcription factor DksA